jgi:hypothetical protein
MVPGSNRYLDSAGMDAHAGKHAGKHAGRQEDAEGE